MNLISKLLFTLSLLLISACATTPKYTKSAVVEYLYPNSGYLVPPKSSPQLNIPLSVGIAFVPSRTDISESPLDGGLWEGEFKPNPLDDVRKQAVLKILSYKFQQHQVFGPVQIIPPDYLSNRGGFDNLSRIQTMYGIDVMALVAFDQIQFFSEGSSSQDFWTLAGKHSINGEKYDTGTLMDVSVYHVNSQSLLFRVLGNSIMKAKANSRNPVQDLREDSIKGFDFSSNMMFANLDNQLTRFNQRFNR